MTPRLRIFGLVLAITIIPSCTLLGPDYKRPENILPAQYSEADAAAAATQSISSAWWELYQDQILNDLVAKALQNNTEIKVAVARIEQADAYLVEVGAALFPEVELGADARRSRVTEAGAFPTFGSNPRNNYIIALGASFELDFWGKLRRAQESARAQALSTQYAKDTVALSLIGLVASNYLLLRSLETEIVITRASLKSREESLALTERRLKGGIASALDVHQAEAASTNLIAQIAELIRLRALTEQQLAVLTGDLGLKLAEGDIEALPIPPTPPAGLPSSLLEARPDVREAEELMVAANAQIGVAKAALYPTISLTASYGGESLELSDVLKSAARIWGGGVDLYLPIFNAGKLNARVDQVTALQKQTLARYQGTIQTAFQEVNDALVSVRQNAEREAALDSSQKAAKKALDISKNRYKSGYSAYLEVLDSERVYHLAQLAFIQSRKARLVATVDLFKALGGGWKDNQDNLSQITLEPN